MSELLAVCIALPLAGTLFAAHAQAKRIAIGALVATLVATLALLLEVLRRVPAESLGTARGWLIADTLNAVPMALFAGIALVTLIAAPRRDVNRRFLITLLTLTSATLASYAAGNPFVFLAGWIVSILPFVLWQPATRLPLVAGAVSLAIGVALIHSSPWAFAFLALAVILREGIFPFHRSTVSLFDGAPLLLAALLINAHPGAFLIAREFQAATPDTLQWLGALALFACLYTAVLAIAEREPRRILAMLIVSQSSALLAGLAAGSHEGIAGALVQWIVLGVSSTMLFAVYRSLEVRVDRPFGGTGFMGLASSMPRLAVFFATSGMTMVGLPGTLGFAGEDLLIHGVLAGYSWWGAALPVAIALNAYNAFRLFARLFLGKDEVTRNTAVDALPRERWALSACLVLLVWGGLVPHQVVSLQAPAVTARVHTNPHQ